MPKNHIAKVENARESFQIMISLMKDERILKMYGLFNNSGCAAGIAQGMLVTFYSSILSDYPLSE